MPHHDKVADGLGHSLHQVEFFVAGQSAHGLGYRAVVDGVRHGVAGSGGSQVGFQAKIQDECLRMPSLLARYADAGGAEQAFDSNRIALFHGGWLHPPRCGNPLANAVMRPQYKSGSIDCVLE